MGRTVAFVTDLITILIVQGDKMKSVKKEVTLIADKTWLISDYYLDNYYLAVGDKKAALIDTGCGIGNVLDEVREITDLPVEVLLTHGHLDHCGGMFLVQ